MVRLAMPILMWGNHKNFTFTTGCVKRSTTKFDFDPTHNSPTWIDAIGIPRGVPDEYKLVDQVAAGFESILLWITPGKNVERINYIHFKVQCLANLTRYAVAGLSEQLHATSPMAY